MSFLHKTLSGAIDEKDVTKKHKIVGRHLRDFRKEFKLNVVERKEILDYANLLSVANDLLSRARTIPPQYQGEAMEIADKHLNEARDLIKDVEEIIRRELGVAHRYLE